MPLRRRTYLFIFLIFLTVYVSTGLVLKITLINPLIPNLAANDKFIIETFAYTILAFGFILGLLVIFIFERAVLGKIIIINNRLLSFLNKDLKKLNYPDEIENLKINVDEVLKELENNRNWIKGKEVFYNESKRTAEALLESKARNNALLKAIPDFVFRFRSDRTLLDFHIPELQKIHLSSEKFINEIVKETLSTEAREAVNTLIDRALETGDVQTFEFRFVDEDEEYFVEVRIVAAAENEEYLAIVRDISERKKAESDINRYIEELQYNEEILEKNAQELQELYGKLSESEAKLIELNQSKDKFFSIISHDLRNPFMALAGFTSMLLETSDKLPPAEIKELAFSINHSAIGILKLLENLLDWSNLQSGKLNFNPAKLNLCRIIDEVLQTINSQFIKKNISTALDLQQQEIYADPFMLEVILRNLFNNAIKYSRENGQVKISSYMAGGFTEVSIEDNGIGISSEDYKKLFKIEEHISTTGTSKEQGTGLGLILCKEFINKHGGDIFVKSHKNEGCTITFRIPIGGFGIERG